MGDMGNFFPPISEIQKFAISPIGTLRPCDALLANADTEAEALGVGV
jgi:hypothetical protein